MTKIQFIQQLLKRFERLDRRHVEDYFSILVQEKGMMEIIFNSMLEGVIVSDQEQHIIFINDSAANFLGGYKDQLLKRSLPDFLNQIGLNEVSDYIQGEWGKLIHRDITINYPVPRVLNLNVFPLISANNVQLGLVLLLVDVTRIREEGLESLRSEKLHTISLMAACLAHEIGNPLNSLDIHLQLLHRDMRSLDSSIRDSFTSSVEIIQAEIRRLDEIVRGFLVAARPMKPNLNGVDVNYLVQDVLKTVDTELHTSSIMLQTSLGKDMPKVLLDTNQIKQALFNLVKNAIEAMQDGGTLRVATIHDQHHAYINIEDTGIGIDQDLMTKIFDPYLTTKDTGSGLGLMIAYRIVKDHGGKIEFTSKKGKGTKFIVTLPHEEKLHARLLNEGKIIDGEHHL